MPNRLSLIYCLILAGALAAPVAPACASGSNYNQLMSRGREHFKQQLYLQSMDEFQQAAQLKPDSPEAFFELGRAEARASSDENAVEALLEALRKDAKLYEARTELAVIFMKRASWDEAGGQLKQVLDAKPDDALVRGNYAICLQELGYLDHAIEQYKIIINKNPRNIEAYYNLALVNQLKGNYDESIACLRKVIAMAPKNSLAYTGLGKSLFGKKDYQSAIAAEKRAIELYPNNHWAYLSLGEMYRSMGRTADSNDSFRRAIQLAPRDPACKQALAELVKQKLASSPVITR